MIVIVDYGIGNIASILNMLKRIGSQAKISSSPDEISAADKLILPGVGAFDTAMRHLNESGLREVLEKAVLEKKTPTIGLCLGMQLLTGGSEEGNLPGLGWIAAETHRFRFPPELVNLKVPHMGWNTVSINPEKPLVFELQDSSRFYFVHSYHVVLGDACDAAATTTYGYEFVSIVQKGHIMGTQFHPEKSHKFGMKLLRNFAELP